MGIRKGPPPWSPSGLTENFCAIAQEEGLDDHLVDMVSRLGGLVVFRDLGRDASWAALEGEEAFRRFRQLAMSQHLRTVVGISLQAKEQAFGVLFLGTADTPAIYGGGTAPAAGAGPSNRNGRRK